MEIHSSTSISDRIVEQLIEKIRKNKLSTGDMLPSERDMMREYGVSRLAYREAIAKMQGMGILKTHHGKGVYLTDIGSISLSLTVLKLLQVYGDISNVNILQARLIIEPPSAGFAAKNANITQRKEILNMTRGVEKDLTGLGIVESAKLFAKADIEFHQFVASASGNPVLPMLLKSMHELLWRIRLEVLIIKPDIAARALADHRKIAAAITEGDVKAAEKAMERHIRLRGKELMADEI